MGGIDPIILAGLIALFVSFLFAISGHLQSLGLDHVDAQSGTVINVGTTAAMMWLATPFYLAPSQFVWNSILLFAIAGMLVPAISLTLTAVSIRRIGPSLTAGFAGVSPVLAMILAAVLVGEILTGQVVAGTLIVAAGVIMLAFRSKSRPVDWPLWVLLLPFGAALCRAITHPVTRLGLLEFPSPMTATLVATTVSFVFLFAMYRVRGNTMPPVNAGFKWFVACGILNGVGLSLLNYALEIGEVIVVSPLIAAVPVWALITSYLYFRRESLTARMAAGILIVFAGCLMVILK